MPVTCNACENDEQNIFLGTIGSKQYFRCRHCGMVFFVEKPKSDNPELVSELEYY